MPDTPALSDESGFITKFIFNQSGTKLFASVVTNGDPGGISGYLYSYNVEPGSGSLKKIQTSPLTNSQNPGDLALNPTGRYIYLHTNYYSTGVYPGSVNMYNINSDGTFSAFVPPSVTTQNGAAYIATTNYK